MINEVANGIRSISRVLASLSIRCRMYDYLWNSRHTDRGRFRVRSRARVPDPRDERRKVGERDSKVSRGTIHEDLEVRQEK